jgi:hypothetical protein
MLNLLFFVTNHLIRHVRQKYHHYSSYTPPTINFCSKLPLTKKQKHVSFSRHATLTSQVPTKVEPCHSSMYMYKCIADYGKHETYFFPVSFVSLVCSLTCDLHAVVIRVEYDMSASNISSMNNSHINPHVLNMLIGLYCHEN